MRAAIVLLAAVQFGSAWAESAGNRLVPGYSPASIVNSASNLTGGFAPNTIVSLYGSGLAFTTKAISPDEIRSGMLPIVLIGTGVSVFINRLPAHILFVSPTQVNLIVPATLSPGPAEFYLTLDGRAGPVIPFRLETASPALYLQAAGMAVATRADGSPISREWPARGGEWVILYATGLGETTPPIKYGAVAKEAARLALGDQFRVLVSGVAVPAASIGYAGIAPGFAGLYQVNLLLPETVGGDVEIRLQAGDWLSPAGVQIPVQAP
ncbi:MAG: hypothetical protein JJE04_18660 [Acidobacteriia bacterium]|nr:hypothetical protein [Terriglobia bacterium]